MNNPVNNRRKIFSFIIYLCFVILLSSNYSFAQEQEKFVTISYKDKKYLVAAEYVCLDIKENFYNQELIDKIKKSGYEIITAKEKYRKLLLKTDGKLHILEYYYKFEKEEYVENVLPYVAATTCWVPNDTDYPSQWHLPKINMPSAWNLTKGNSNVRIGILDSGIPMYSNGNLSHPELQSSRIKLGGNFTEYAGHIVDNLGHGTHVAGIVGAETNNGTGIAGVCPNSELYISKVIDDGDHATNYGIANAIYNAIYHNCKIISLSLKVPGDPNLDLYDAINYANNQSVLIVIAAGNNYKGSVTCPATYASTFSNVMAVSATDMIDSIAYFSSIGPEVTVAAPGYHIYSTTPNYPNSYYSPNFDYSSGTSMAAPIVAGIAGLIKSKFPHYSAAQIRKQIELSADDLGIPGKDIYYGAGRVNTYDAVKNLYVPQMYSTIQDALNYATDGQTIVVSSGTYSVNSTITIPAGVTLQIKAGTTVIMGSGCHITSYGKIIALGEANNHIKFTTPNPTTMGWDGIHMYGSGSNGSVFKYCDIKDVFMSSGYMLSFYNSLSEISYCDISYNLPYYGEIYADNSCLDIYKNKLQNNGGVAVVGYNDSFIMLGAMGLHVDCNSGNNAITNNASGIWADYFSRFDLEDYYGLERNHMNNISGNSSYNARATNYSIIDASCGTNYWGGNPPPGLVIDGTSIFWFGNIPNCIPGLPFNIGVIEENNSIAMIPELKKVASSNAVSSDINEELRRARGLAYAENYNEAMDIYKSILLNNRDIEYIGQALNGMLFIYRVTQDKDLLEYLKVYSRGETDAFAKVVYANALIVSNCVEEALSEYNEIAKKNPKTIHEIVALIQQSYIYYFDKKDVKRANEILAEVEKSAEKDDIHVKQLKSIVARGTSTDGGNNEYFGNEEDMQETEIKMAGYSLGNYPNPFNPTTTIQYSIPKDEFVKLTVYDITGRIVKELVGDYKTAGKYSVEFNASSYSSGTYYYKLEAGEYKNIQKMMLVK